MFHERLEFKFGERVNFIIGKNGSRFVIYKYL